MPSTFTDTFTRANGAIGSPWVQTASSGTADFEISSNTARTTRAAGGSDVIVAATVDLGEPIGLTEWDLSTWPKGPVYSFFRFVDLNNTWGVFGSNGTPGQLYISRRVAGTWTTMATTSSAPTWGAGHRLSVVDTGTLITVLVDGSPVSGVTSADTTHNTATRSGIGGNARSSGGAGIPYLQDARWTRFHIEGR